MKYKFSNLINIDTIQALTDSFCEAVGIASAIIDIEGTVLISSRWQKVCTDFHRVNPDTCRRCIESDTTLANQLLKGREYAIYECRNGLIDAAAPIMIEGKHIANFFIGQFLFEPPDVEYFQNQAREYGFDETSYLEALSLVPIIAKKRIKPILGFLSGFSEFLGEMGLKQIRQMEMADALQKSETKYRLLAENVADVIWTRDIDLQLTYISPSIYNLTGYMPEEVFNMTLDRILPSQSLELAHKTFKEELALEASGRADPNRTLTLEVEHICKDDSVVCVEMKMSAIRDQNGRRTGILGVTRDITNRKLAEDQIRQSLREKETLLAEIHHRVKNNMQIISSLLSLQSKDIKDEKALSLIRNSEERIRAMSLIHEKLYLSKDLSRVDFSDYVKDLSIRLFQMYRVDSRKVSFLSHIKDVFFSIETAIPLGLITNELISNSMKYAFPEARKGNISVDIKFDKKAGKYTLTVTDNGIGIPEAIDYKNPKAFGLQLVGMLTKQLGGTMEMDRKEGTLFRITFGIK